MNIDGEAVIGQEILDDLGRSGGIHNNLDLHDKSQAVLKDENGNPCVIISGPVTISDGGSIKAGN
ncbi:MAG: hypothetical protein LBF56_00855 [Holosporales bacterium]|nr:hypothetical protein [Holosporales bacterium]